MITGHILTSRGTTFDIDVLIGDEPDALGAARIVPGNVSKAVKAIIVGQREFERENGKVLGPMASGDTMTSTDPRFEQEVLRVLGVSNAPACFKAVVPMHDRYESQAQYDLNWL